MDVEKITMAFNQSLPWVVLKETFPEVDEDPENPPTDIQVPTVMTNFQNIPDPSYRFMYEYMRYVKLNYLIERDVGIFESGTIEFYHDRDFTVVEEDENPEDPPDEASPEVPVLRVYKAVKSSYGDVGVDIGFMHEDDSEGSQCALAFKITDATSPTFPKITANYDFAFEPYKEN